jgi:hypothetical protein
MLSNSPRVAPVAISKTGWDRASRLHRRRWRSAHSERRSREQRRHVLVMCGPIGRVKSVDITHLRADARRCFAGAGIQPELSAGCPSFTQDAHQARTRTVIEMKRGDRDVL